MPYTLTAAGVPAAIVKTYYRISNPGRFSTGAGCETLAGAHAAALAASSRYTAAEIMVEEWVMLEVWPGHLNRHESRDIAAYVAGARADEGRSPAEYAQDRQDAENRAFRALQDAQRAESQLRWTSCPHADIERAEYNHRAARATWETARNTVRRAQARAEADHGPRPTFATRAEALAAARP